MKKNRHTVDTLSNPMLTELYDKIDKLKEHAEEMWYDCLCQSCGGMGGEIGVHRLCRSCQGTGRTESAREYRIDFPAEKT